MHTGMIKMLATEGTTDAVEFILASGLGTFAQALAYAAAQASMLPLEGQEVAVDREQGTVRPGR